MKNWNADAIAALLFGIFMLVIFAIGFASDVYRVYLLHHTFQVAYESAMNCRTEQGKKGFSTSVDKICGSIPKWGDYSK